MLAQAICLPTVGFLGCNGSMAILFFCLSEFGKGFADSGYQVNHIDIAPRYASLLFGITNTASVLAGILAPTTIGNVTEGNVS